MSAAPPAPSDQSVLKAKALTAGYAVFEVYHQSKSLEQSDLVVVNAKARTAASPAQNDDRCRDLLKVAWRTYKGTVVDMQASVANPDGSQRASCLLRQDELVSAFGPR